MHKAAMGRARDRPQARAVGERAIHMELAPGYVRASAEIRSSEVIYSAVSRIANALATMPVQLYRGDERMAGDARDALLSLRPNRRQSAFLFKQAMEVYRNTEGRAYAVKRFNRDYQLREIVPLDPTRVTPCVEEESGDVWFCVRRDDGKEEWLHNWYVLSLFHVSPNGVSGVRVVDVLRESLDYNAQIKTFSLANLKAVNRGIVLEFPSHLAGPRRENAVDEFLKLYRASGGQVIALESGIKASTLAMSPIESGMFDAEKITRSRVAMVYNMPPSLLGDTSSAGKATAEEQTNEFLTLTMQPIVEQWEEELNYKLLTPEERAAGYEFRIDVDAYLRASATARATVAQSRIRCGLRTVNEIRKADHMPPVPGGDSAMISKDLAPVELVAKGATVDADAINGDHNAKKGKSE